MYQDRLAAIREQDRERALFGAQHHKHRSLPPLDESELAAIEAAVGVQLPAAYRRYVAEVSGGGMGPGYGLPWLPAVLDDPESDRLPHQSVAARMFPDDEARAWAGQEFAPLSDAEIQERLASFPPAVAEQQLRAAAWVRSHEGRRNRYIDHCCEQLRTMRGERAKLPFPFTSRHTAAPEIDEIDWQSLDSDTFEREWSRLRRDYGFDAAENGTLRLSNYGCGVTALLVVTGTARGAVWMYDTENLVLEPFFPEWANWHDFPSPEPPWDFDAWIQHWMDGAEERLRQGVRPAGRLLWD